MRHIFLTLSFLGFLLFEVAAADPLPRIELENVRRERVETGLRKSLTFYEQQQHGGGWASAYSLDL